MAVHNRPQPLPFLVTTEMPCPYLPGRIERKLVTELSGPAAVANYELLSRSGFRRSHSIAYRPACPRCQACVPVRVVAAGFRPSRTQRRVQRRNAGLIAALRSPRATPEQYALFSRYLEGRHGDGEMVDMSFHDYRTMVEDSPLDTRLVEFRDGSGRLLACCLCDSTDDGVSAVYSFFDPALPERSLGTYVVLWLIAEARRRGLPYVYLGYWVAGSPKMSYKARFRPIEAFGRDGWRVLPDRS